MQSLKSYLSLFYQVVHLARTGLVYLPVWPRGVSSAELTVGVASSVLNINNMLTCMQNKGLLQPGFPKVF